MSEHSTILLQSPTTAPAAAKNVLPVQEQLTNELEILPLQKTSIQFKLAIGTTDDPLEHEADAMAETVMRMPEQNFVQRKCVGCEEEEEKLQRKPLASFIQRKESSTNATASDAVSNKINASKGGGINLDSHTQSFMQSRFGADFGDVKIHTGSEAIQMNRELNAKAFTVGSDIYFNEGQYNPDSGKGKRLVAHELTHVVQQRDNSKNIIRRTGSPIIKGCKPTRRTGKLAFQGNTEHIVIAQFHQFEHPNAESEYAIPESGATGGMGYADIIDRSENVIFEIKSATSAATAPYELLKYIEKYTEHCDPDTTLNLGTDYKPIIPLMIPAGLLQTSLLSPGIIVYTVTPITPPPVGVPIPVPVPKSVLKEITDAIKDAVKDIGPVVAAAATAVAAKVLFEKVLGEAFKKLIPFLGVATAAATLLAILSGAKPSFAFGGSVVDSLKAMASDGDVKGEEGGTGDKDTGAESGEGKGESEGEGKGEGQEKGDGQGIGEGKSGGDEDSDKQDRSGSDAGKTPDGEKDSDQGAVKGTGKGSKESGDGKTEDDDSTKANGTGKGKGISKQTKDKLDKLPPNLKKLWGGLTTTTGEGVEITDADVELFLKYIEKFKGDISGEALADLIKKLRKGNQPLSEMLKSFDSSSPTGDQTGTDQRTSDSKTSDSTDQEYDVGSKTAGRETTERKSDGETEGEGESERGPDSKTETTEGESGTTSEGDSKDAGDKSSGDRGGSGGGEKDLKDTTEEPPVIDDYTKVNVSDERRESGSLISFNNIKFHYAFKEDIRGKDAGVQIAMILKLTKGSKVLFNRDVLAIITNKNPIYTEEQKPGVVPKRYELLMTMIEPKAIRFTNKKDEKDFIDLVYLRYSYDL